MLKENVIFVLVSQGKVAESQIVNIAHAWPMAKSQGFCVLGVSTVHDCVFQFQGPVSILDILRHVALQ